jgi:hypothetical protein
MYVKSDRVKGEFPKKEPWAAGCESVRPPAGAALNHFPLSNVKRLHRTPTRHAGQWSWLFIGSRRATRRAEATSVREILGQATCPHFFLVMPQVRAEPDGRLTDVDGVSVARGLGLAEDWLE